MTRPRDGKTARSPGQARRACLAVCVVRAALVAGLLGLAGVGHAEAGTPPEAPSTRTERVLAVTFDDLPWAHHAHEPVATIADAHARLLSALKAHGVRATGFANPDQIESGALGDGVGARLLADWLVAGHELGNHTWGHLDLHAVGTVAFKAGIVAADASLRPLAAAHGASLRWFRHPYLRTGLDRAQREAVEAFLGRRGYRVAPVTVDNSDWIYALAYLRLQERSADGSNWTDFRAEYIDYLMAKLRYYDAQANALLGTSLPQVLLLHANRLNADTVQELLSRTRGEGWRFVPLDVALSHPAYRRPDQYRGRFGPGWIHRWAIAEGKGRQFFGEEPRVPPEVLALAGVESE